MYVNIMTFLNFCDKSLRTDVTCSTICTEGYEVTNLVNNYDSGFLAYSSIKPPVYIDFVFICNIKISYIIVWPQIGAQKSCGFKISVKSTNIQNEPFTDVSTAFIKKEEPGVFFYRRDIQKNIEKFAPANFAHRYIKSFDINFVSSLRLSILKTDNSVPALAKVEIWGQASPQCGKDVVSNVMALWTNNVNTKSVVATQINSGLNDEKATENRVADDKEILNVPEDFLDSITYEIMTQPIILPSGKIIDQKTLEKHANNEAIWGRPVSDPFTGIRFSHKLKPIAALPLKARIDKFLLENSNLEEIKKLPRVLGSVEQKFQYDQVITCSNSNSLSKDSNLSLKVNQLKRTFPEKTHTLGCVGSFNTDLVPPQKLSRKSFTEEVLVNKDKNSDTNLLNSVKSNRNNINFFKTTSTLNNASSSGSKKSFRSHLLPLAIPKTSLKNRSYINKTSKGLVLSKEEILKNNALIEKKLDLSTRVNNLPECQCCTNSIFYKLPCEHVICRNALLSLKYNKCSICNKEFQTSDPQRIHLT